MNRKTKVAILIILDSMINGASGFFAYVFMKPYVPISADFLRTFIPALISLYIIFGWVFRVFTRINRYTNLREILAIFFSTTFTASTIMIIGAFVWDSYSRRYILLTYIVSTLGVIGSRLAWRLLIEYLNRRKQVNTPSSKRTIVIGAGDGGKVLLNTLQNSPTNNEVDIVGFVDDDSDKYHTYLNTVKVMGTIKDLPKLIPEYNIQAVTIAIPSLKKARLNEIIDELRPLNVKVTTIPSMEETATGGVTFSQLRDIDVIDLLGRDEVKLDMDAIKGQLTNQVILITGAGGSIGSEIARQVMRFSPKQLILLGHGENSIYLINKELRNNYPQKNTEIIPVIADIQDKTLIDKIMAEYRPDIVYHAAAHKHVPLMEANPREAVKNNIFGTQNVAEAARKNNVEHFVMISTDKAVNPPNIMGATKRVAEMLIMGLHDESKNNFSVVRFGNVLGSRGSVIPLFKEQIARGGPVTVTDFRMTRFFMTIPEASRLVIQAGALAKGGEIFILDMGEPVKILDLAKNMIKLSGYAEEEIPIVESGMRPGEKLYEELLVDKEKNPKQVHQKIFVGSVNGFNYKEVSDFIKHLPTNDEELKQAVIEYANESSK